MNKQYYYGLIIVLNKMTINFNQLGHAKLHIVELNKYPLVSCYIGNRDSSQNTGLSDVQVDVLDVRVDKERAQNWLLS